MKTIAPPIPNAVIGQAIRHGTDNRACSLRWLRVTAGVGVAPDRCPWGMDSLHPNVRVIPHMTPDPDTTPPRILVVNPARRFGFRIERYLAENPP